MSAILYMGIAITPKQIKMDLFYLPGRMIVRQRAMLYMAGGLAHAGMSIFFALIHVGVCRALDDLILPRQACFARNSA